MEPDQDLSAAEAAAQLGVSRATLYAYVSRGLLRSYPGAADPRARRYRQSEVARLLAQTHSRSSQAIAGAALEWGAPVLESGLTLIRAGQLYYRGQEVTALAQRHSFEQVAALLWTGALPNEAAPFAALTADPTQFMLPANLSLLQRFQAALPLLAAQDQAAFDTRPAAVIRSAGRIVRLFAALLSGQATAREAIAVQLRHGLAPQQPEAESLFDLALVLCADHELNVSAFTARCVASSGASPYEVVGAGLCALAGVRHGGQTERAVALLREVARPEDAVNVIAERLRRGEPVPGFGHRIYPASDPRAAALLGHLNARYPDSAAVQAGAALCAAAQQLLGEHPTIDMALAVLAQTLAAPPGTALALFALGRTVGWVAHALEEYQLGRLIRPRATYTGPLPVE